MKFDISAFFESLSGIFKFHENLTRVTGTLHEDGYTFLIMSRSVLLRMRHLGGKKERERIKTHILCSMFVFFPKIVLFVR